MTASRRLTITRPYFLRATYDWIVDNACTPYLLVNADYPNVSVPQDSVNDGKIVLNISPQAVSRLELNNDIVRFQARFHGVVHRISIPIMAVLSVYARENGRGIVFEEEEGVVDGSVQPVHPQQEQSPTQSAERRKRFNIVKPDRAEEE